MVQFREMEEVRMAVYKVTVKAKVAGQEINNVVHFYKEVVDDTTKQQLSQHIKDRIIGQWVFLQCRELRYFEFRIERPKVPNDVPFIFPVDDTGLFNSDNNYILPITAVLQLKTST